MYKNYKYVHNKNTKSALKGHTQKVAQFIENKVEKTHLNGEKRKNT